MRRGFLPTLVVLVALGVSAFAAQARADKPPLSAKDAEAAAQSLRRGIDQENSAVVPGLFGASKSLALGVGLEDVRRAYFVLYAHDASGISALGDATHALDLDIEADHIVTHELSHATTDEKQKLVSEIRRLIERALGYKRSAVRALDAYATAHGSRVCEVEKEFQVFAIPAGFSGSYADVFPHGIPKDAKNVKVSFVDLATGKAPAPEVFPGQTWTSVDKGYQANGKYDVPVDVSGTGFGKPNANVKNWKVVVTYDCP